MVAVSPDGRPLERVTEARLREVGASLREVARAGDHPRWQSIVDAADYLLGDYGDPGSPWPQRSKLPDRTP